MKGLLIIVTIIGVLLIAACGAESTPEPSTFESPLAEPTSAPEATPTADAFESPLGLPNPASKFCEDQGYTLEMREEAGGTAGYCLFPDGSECEEWAYYRGECGPPTPVP
jgi:putative hemolysin